MLLHDIRHAFRLLFRTPAITAVALLSIAITTGATAVVFTAIKSVLINPLPYSKPAELVQLRMESTKFGKSHADWVTWSDIQDVIRSNHTLASLGTYGYALFNLSSDGSAPPEALSGLNVSANMFPTLGVTPLLAELEQAIYQWLDHWNQKPQPFVWKATADVILDKVRRCREAIVKT